MEHGLKSCVVKMSKYQAAFPGLRLRENVDFLKCRYFDLKTWEHATQLCKSVLHKFMQCAEPFSTALHCMALRFQLYHWPKQKRPRAVSHKQLRLQVVCHIQNSRENHQVRRILTIHTTSYCCVPSHSKYSHGKHKGWKSETKLTTFQYVLWL